MSWFVLALIAKFKSLLSNLLDQCTGVKLNSKPRFRIKVWYDARDYEFC